MRPETLGASRPACGPKVWPQGAPLAQPARRIAPSCGLHFFALSLGIALCACAPVDSDTRLVPSPPPINVSGVWAGTWSGQDPNAGTVTGNWEADLTQTSEGITGSGTLSGDVDCTDGPVTGGLNADFSISGTFHRAPCPTNQWTLSSLSFLNRTVTAEWTQTATRSGGTLSGYQIALPNGPRIRYFFPPGGLPGSYVTIVGERLAPVLSDNSVTFNQTAAPTQLVAGTTSLLAKVPSGVTYGSVIVATPTGSAISPRPFDVNVTAPSLSAGITIPVGQGPEGVGISLDGRRAFVANRSSGSVSMINLPTANILATSNVAKPSGAAAVAQGVAMSPDGKRVYVASGSAGVTVLSVGTNSVITVLPANAGGGPQPNPQGIAVSPDGQRLLVSNNQDGGAVTIIDLASGATIAGVSLGTGAVPLGIAVHPDGQKAYLAFAGPNANVIKVFSFATNSIIATIAVGQGPTGIAVTPDGGKFYVSNQTDNTVSPVDATTNVPGSPIAVGSAPRGIAASPDGAKVFVANSGSNTISEIDTATDAVSGTLILAPPAGVPTGLAIAPSGQLGYFTNTAQNSMGQIGQSFALTVSKSGSGFGVVSSAPSGLSCGTNCQMWSPAGSVVTLQAAAADGSTFSGWSGDADCSDGVVTMNSNVSCVATFTFQSGGGGTGGGGISCSPDCVPVGGACFIATAAYGSFLDPHVHALREFRDRRLRTNAFGREFISFYYDHSPHVAAFIAAHESARVGTRLLLTPLVFAIECPWMGVLALSAFIAVWLLLSRWRFQRRREARRSS
jgi:YVTN family beta-propeller protein